MKTGTNAPTKPQFEGQLVKFKSDSGVTLLDEAIRNPKYGYLEWCAINPDHASYSEKMDQAFWVA
jgi:hypothetical protein